MCIYFSQFKYPTQPHVPIHPPTPLNKQVSCLMPPITRASCQLENFIITNHNTHYTKRKVISQHQHIPTPTNMIKPNSKSQKIGKILIKLKLQPIAVQKNQINFVLKKRERERERDSHSFHFSDFR